MDSNGTLYQSVGEDMSSLLAKLFTNSNWFGISLLFAGIPGRSFVKSREEILTQLN